SVENYGLVLRGTVDLERTCELGELPYYIDERRFPKHLGWRYVWDPTTARPAFNDLVAHWVEDFHFVGDAWAGDASLTFYDAENGGFLGFQRRRVVGGWFSIFWTGQLTMDTPARPEVIYDFNSEVPPRL